MARRSVAGPVSPQVPVSPQAFADRPQAWRVGDLAECVGSGVWITASGRRLSGPARGEIRVVAAIRVRRDRATGQPRVWLRFARWPHAFCAGSFRRIEPRPERMEPCGAAFLPLLARFRPRVAAL